MVPGSSVILLLLHHQRRLLSRLIFCSCDREQRKPKRNAPPASLAGVIPWAEPEASKYGEYMHQRFGRTQQHRTTGAEG
uniref:Putative secreted protein n=1 Tax=Anopheles triannulatus TaxID=58253 RepID=A0A2M4B3M9_9DIPT